MVGWQVVVGPARVKPNHPGSMYFLAVRYTAVDLASRVGREEERWLYCGQGRIHEHHDR